MKCVRGTASIMDNDLIITVNRAVFDEEDIYIDFSEELGYFDNNCKHIHVFIDNAINDTGFTMVVSNIIFESESNQNINIPKGTDLIVHYGFVRWNEEDIETIKEILPKPSIFNIKYDTSKVSYFFNSEKNYHATFTMGSFTGIAIDSEYNDKAETFRWFVE